MNNNTVDNSDIFDFLEPVNDNVKNSLEQNFWWEIKLTSFIGSFWIDFDSDNSCKKSSFTEKMPKFLQQFFLKELFRQSWDRLYFNNNTIKIKIQNLYIFQEYYIFEADFGTYHVKISDFQVKWLKASFIPWYPLKEFNEYKKNKKNKEEEEKTRTQEFIKNLLAEGINLPNLWWINDIKVEDLKNIDTLWNIKVSEFTLKDIFNHADTEGKVEQVWQALLQIESLLVWKWFDKGIVIVKKMINEKKQKIKIEELKLHIKKLEDDFQKFEWDKDKWNNKYFNHLISLQVQVKELEKTISQILIIDNELDKNISELLDKVNVEITSFRIKNTDSIIVNIDEKIKEVEAFLSNINYLPQITQVYNNPLYLETEGFVDLLEDEQKKTYKQKLEEIILNKIEKLKKIENDEKKAKEEKLKVLIWEVENNIHNLSKIADSINDEKALEIMRQGDNLVTKIKWALETLPKNEAEKLSLSLESVFNDRKLQIRLTKLNTSWLIYSLDEYGINTSLYYSDKFKKQVWFKLLWDRTGHWDIRLKLIYDDGTIFNIDTYLQDPQKFSHAIVFDDIQTEVSQQEFVSIQKNLVEWKNIWKKKLEELNIRLLKVTEEWKEEVIQEIEKLKKKYLKARKIEFFATNLANRLNLNPRSKLQLPDSRFIVLDEEKELLTKLSNGFFIQKMEQKWIDIVEWPPWLWKTSIVNFFSANTNREIARVQCSKTDPADLFFSPQLKAWETTRQPADWIKLMQKPWTIILFDEIDKLPPEAFERLHSLFDDARSIYDPQFGMIKAHPDCLFVWTRNSYEKLSNPITSRSVIHIVKAPSELNEAYKISKYIWISFFEELEFNSFKNFWENSSVVANDENTKKIYRIIELIKKIVNIFNELRLKQASSDYEEKFEYEISYRDAEQIFRRFNMANWWDFKQIVSDIIISKARAVVYENEDKNNQERIAKTVINSKL